MLCIKSTRVNNGLDFLLCICMNLRIPIYILMSKNKKNKDHNSRFNAYCDEYNDGSGRLQVRG